MWQQHFVSVYTEAAERSPMTISRSPSSCYAPPSSTLPYVAFLSYSVTVSVGSDNHVTIFSSENRFILVIIDQRRLERIQ